MAIKNAKEFVELVENQLGWAPPIEEVTERKPLWKHRIIMAGRVKKVIEKDPNLYTWHNLELAIEFCRRKRIEIKSPMGVLYKVKQAVDASADTKVTDLEAERNAAIEWELAHQRPGHEEWVGRLVRADGSARRDVLELWRSEGRGDG